MGKNFFFFFEESLPENENYFQWGDKRPTTTTMEERGNKCTILAKYKF